MSDSILLSVKKILGLDADYTAFDEDVIMHINTALGALQQLGVGPEEGLEISDDVPTWDDLIDTTLYGPASSSVFRMARAYVYLRVRLLFDPPQTSFLLEAMNNQLQEYEWRISAERERYQWTAPVVSEA